MTAAPELHGSKPGNPGLWDLDSVPLPSEQQDWLARAVPGMHGSPSWRRRKQAEIRDLFALAVIAPRLTVMAVDPRTTLRVCMELRAPVPCRPPDQEAAGGDELTIAERARLVLLYPEEAMRMPLPGYAFVEIDRPLGVFHPNVGDPSGGGRQILCLGASILPGTPVRELILASYQALSMAAYHVDPRAGAGVMSKEAALWWAANLERVPLTSEPFLPLRAAKEVSP